MIDVEGARTLLAPGPGRRLGFAVAEAGVRVTTSASLAWVLVESGDGQLVVDGTTVAVIPRTDVFSGPGSSALLGPGQTATAATSLRCLVVWRPYDGPPVDSCIIEPAHVVVEQRGNGAFARTVRTYLPHGALIAGETINPPGGWSSYPPHRHDDHEEAYLYRFQPENGFGLAATYDGDERSSQVVRDGDVTWIPRGYHPVVAAPGYAMTYIWALAGDTATFAPTLDPAHAWVG